MAVRQKILVIEEAPEAEAALPRGLRRKYNLDVVAGPMRALEAITEQGPYAVVVAGLRMPGMDGIEFFSRLQKACPDTRRILLAAEGDWQAAMDAVNTCGVFRFLPKPCPDDRLEAALAVGVAQYQQRTAEKIFLKGALRGIIKLLTDLLALANPEAMARSARIKPLVADMARYLEAPDRWRIELAVTLSPLGAVVMPESMFATLRVKGELEGAAAELYARHPSLGADLLGNIPKFQEIAAIIRYQEAPFVSDGTSAPTGRDIPLGARLLKVALDYDRLLTSGLRREQAKAVLAGREGVYDPQLLEVLELLAGGREGYGRTEVMARALTAGMVLEEDLVLETGEKLAQAGQMVDSGLLERLGALDAAASAQPVKVLSPVTDALVSGFADPELLALLRHVRRAVSVA